MSFSWTTSCVDWEKRIVAGQTLTPCAPLFPEQAAAAWAIFSELRMVDAPGSPRMGVVVEPWVRELVEGIFGAYDADTGRRLIREFMLLISKKNGKSTIAAGIMLTALLLNWRLEGEFIVLAPTKEVADNSYKPIAAMIRADDELGALLKVQDHIRTITHLTTNATLKVVAADGETVSGKKAIGVFIDELWLFGKNPKADAMLLEATGGLASRPEGFVIFATTQSDDPPAGAFLSRLLYARGVRDGRIDDPAFYPILYEFPKAMLDAGAHREVENAYITNPNMGVSVDEEFIRRGYRQAQEKGEAEFRGFLAKHLNVEIGLNLRSDRWAGAEFWEAAAIPVFTLEELIARCDVATVGIDGGGLDDLLGLSATGRERGTGRLLAWFHAWAHEIALDRRKEIAPALLDFVKQGDLTIVKVPGDDVIQVADYVCLLNDAGLLPKDKAIGVDAAGIIDIVTELVSAERGIDMEQIVAIRQGYSLNGAIKSTERQVAAKTLVHAGRPMMNWCVGNARIEDKGNAILVTKAASGKAKIDPLMALFNAVSLMALNPVGRGSSVYETRGIRMI